MNRKTDSKRLFAGLALALAAAPALAMPTKKDLAAAQSIVQDLTADDMHALKAKQKSSVEVAAAHIALADKADTEAGKYLLLQGAFRLYARGGDYDAAAGALQRMRDEISGLPPEAVVEIVDKEMRKVADSKAPKVVAIFRDAQRTIKCRKRLAAAEAAAKKDPANAKAQRAIAECHAALGDWDKALESFAKIGEAAAKWEKDPASAKDYDVMKAANFWWDYKSSDDEPFKIHAAVLYRDAIAMNKISGLRREMANKRIAELEASGATLPNTGRLPRHVPATSATDTAPTRKTANVTAPTATSWDIPANFKAPLVRSLDLGDGFKMEFCAVPAGTFNMSGGRKGTHKVKITRPFWFSKTHVTQSHMTHIIAAAIGRKPEDGGEASKKVHEKVYELEKRFPEFYIIRGCGQAWGVKLSLRLLSHQFATELPDGYVFRLPTEAEWEYANTDCGKIDINGMRKAVEVQFNENEKLSRKLLAKIDNRFGKNNNYALHLYPRNLPVNGLGIIKLPPLHNNFTLDCIDWHGGEKPNIIDATSLLKYSDFEVDPLRVGSLRLVRHLNPEKGNKDRSLVDDKVAAWGHWNVVIGPDLEAEKEKK